MTDTESTIRTAKPSLREVVAKFLNDFATHAVKVCPASPEEDYWAGELLALLSQHGVVRLDENQELPEVPFDEVSDAFRIGRSDMVQDNFKRVCPLVEEK